MKYHCSMYVLLQGWTGLSLGGLVIALPPFRQFPALVWSRVLEGWAWLGFAPQHSNFSSLTSLLWFLLTENMQRLLRVTDCFDSVLGGRAHDFFIAKGAWATGSPRQAEWGGTESQAYSQRGAINQADWSLKVVTSHPTKWFSVYFQISIIELQIIFYLFLYLFLSL